MRDARIICDVDISAVERLARDLDSAQLKKALRAGFRKSALVIRRGVQKEVKVSTSPHRNHVKTWTRRGYFYAKPLYKDVKMQVYKTEIGANVTLCNPRRNPNRAYVLRMLNSGTDGRATKKGLYRGSVGALNFFEKGVSATEDKAIADLNKNIRDAVIKMANK